MNLTRLGRAVKLDPPTPFPDPALPYWVVTDHAIVGTFTNGLDAVAHADLYAITAPYGERVQVRHWGQNGLGGYYSTTGQGR